MNSDVLVSLITLCGSALGAFVGIVVNTKMTNYRIGQLEKKQDIHNKVIERVYLLEQHNAVIDEEIKVANHRIEDLERKNEHE